MTIGKHEEFTLYAAVALQNGTENPNQSLFQQAQHVHGWGKIHLVERLDADTTKIKKWLLCYGCENSIMNQYLAFTCATKGELKQALSEETIDVELYRGAGIILSALIEDGPVENIDSYVDAQEALIDYIRHTFSMGKESEHLLVIGEILTFLTAEEEGCKERYAKSWNPETRSRLTEQCREIMAWPTWKDALQTALEKQDTAGLYLINRLAELLDVDVWPTMFQMLQTEPLNRNLYDYLMKTDGRERILKLVQFAEGNLPLQEIASGPAKELGLGLEYQAHDCLDCILQELDRFDGIGMILIKSALQSPVVRNRNMALKALEGWKKEAWEAELMPTLSSLVEGEPEEDVKQRMNALMKRVVQD